MKKSKFIEQMEDIFGTSPLEEATKKEKIEILVQKLQKRFNALKTKLKTDLPEEMKDDIKESLDIIKKQIKKGKKLLK